MSYFNSDLAVHQASRKISPLHRAVVLQEAVKKSEQNKATNGSIGKTSREGKDALTRFRMSVKRTLSQTKLDLKEHNQRIEQVKLENILLEGKDLLATTVPELEQYDDEEKHVVAKETAVETSFHDLTNDMIQDACSSALRLIYDVKSLRNNKIMLEYIRKVFSSVPKDTFDLLSKESKNKDNKVLILKCNVIKANDLPAKDFNVASDVYCIAAILDKEQRHCDIKVLKEEGLITETWQSSVKMNTLDPVWNDETFELSVTDPQNQYLAIELWDCHKDQKGLAVFFHKADHFIGRAFYSLQDVTTNGEEKTLDLTSKHSSGMVTMFMKITGNKDDKQPQDSYLSQKRLLECIIMKESKTEDGYHSTHWDCKLSEEAEKLLVQHASLHRISQLQQSAIQLSVLLKYHRVHHIAMHALSNVLHTMQRHESEILQASIHESNLFWVHQLLKDLEEIRVHIINIMKGHLIFYNYFTTIKSISRLKDHTRVLHDLYQLRFLKSHLSPDQQDLRAVLTNAIQTAVPHCMILFTANMKPDHTSPERTLSDLSEICFLAVRQCQRSWERVHPVFMEIGVDYFSPFYVSMDKIVYGEAISRLEGNSSTKTGLLTYIIFKIVQMLEDYSHKVDPEFLKRHHVTLSVTKFQYWFKDYVSDWFIVGRARVRERMDRAIELDTIVETSNKAPFSSSAVDAHAFILQGVYYWKGLNWPDRGQSLGCFVTTVKSLCDLTVYYTYKIANQMKKDLNIDCDGCIIVTDKLCVALNNIHHVSEVLKNIRSELDLERYYKWLDEEKQEDGGLPLSERADTIITNLLKSANGDVWNKIQDVITVVKTKLSPSVIGFLPKILSAPPSSAPDKVIEPLIEYITENVGKLGELLLTPMFLDILHHLWGQIVVALKDLYDKIPHSSANPLHVRLSYVLLHLSYFFEADGKGLNRKFIESETYMTLKNSLYCAVKPTEDVIKMFCCDLVSQQASSKNEFGQLHISHMYNQDKKVLSVEILMGENLPALDRNGKSDPFVQVYLLPAFVFPEAGEKVHKTSIQKETLSPLFNETINLPVKPEQLSKDSSIILLAIFDYDTIWSNDFAGLCVVPCASTPVEGTEPKIEHLYLFQYKKTDAYKELELRHTDAKAHDFLKYMKKFVF